MFGECAPLVRYLEDVEAGYVEETPSLVPDRDEVVESPRTGRSGHPGPGSTARFEFATQRSRGVIPTRFQSFRSGQPGHFGPRVLLAANRLRATVGWVTGAVSEVPTTRYAKSGELHIAYQVVGEGPFDLIYAPGFISHVEMNWESPYWTSVLGRLSRFCRLIIFNNRGTGLSDRVGGWPTLESVWTTSGR